MSMNRGCMAAIAVGVVGLVVVLILVASLVSTMNTEARLRTAIEAKQLDNTSEFDNMFKKISQVAQVSEKQMQSLKEIFVEHAQARTGPGGGGSLATWIKESVPNVDTKTFDNLQNIITASRDRWTMRQKELVDLDRERKQMFRVFPSSLYLSVLGRREGDVSITVVTSSRTERAFETGKDDDTSVFREKGEAE